MSMSRFSFRQPDTHSLSRRNFLESAAMGTAAAVAMVSTQNVLPAEDQHKLEIIDAHSHIWTTDLKRYPLQPGQTIQDLEPRSFTPEELMAVAAPVGVKKVVLIQHNIFHGTDNSYIADTIEKEPQKYSGVACIDATGADPAAEMTRLRKEGFRGMRIRPGDGGEKVRWRDSPGMHAMWDRGPEIGVAMCPLINPEDLAEVHHMCSEYEETTVVVDHFARIGIDGKIRKSDLQQLTALAKFPKVNVKISAYYALGKKQPPHDELIPMIKSLYETFGPERLMWASDCPYQLTGPNTYADSVALIQQRIDFLSKKDKQSLLYDTADRVFFS